MGVIRLLGPLAVLLVMVSWPAVASAQYFGRNKVEYEDFDFRVLATPHFDVHYYPAEERGARIVARLAERWYARLSTVLRHQLERRQPLVLYGSQPEFAQTNVVTSMLPDTVGGVTDGARHRIAMPFAPTMAETDRVLGHELVHAFQFDIARRGGGSTGQPLWFIEGMAEYLSRGSRDRDAFLWLRDAVLHGGLPERASEASRQLSPYLFGHAFWTYLAQQYGDGVIDRALRPGRKNWRLNARLRHATGKELDALYEEWRADARRRYGEIPPDLDRDSLWDGDTMQLGPALSPDGRLAAFFAERDRLSVDLFVADVATRKVVRRVTTIASATFDSLQPLRSSGAWSADGRWFAFAAVRQGRATLMMFDMHDQEAAREIVFERVGQVLSASWAPDNRRLVLSALAGGFTDLYLYDLDTGGFSQLTDDEYADLQPAWSRDGRSIAFATERYSSDPDRLTFGAPQLAILDVATQSIRRVDAGSSRMQLNPQWATGDGALYFVGDSGGARNVYRIELASAVLERLTRVSTGISGITPTSPALALAAEAPLLAFTVYRQGKPRMIVHDLEALGIRAHSAPAEPLPPTPPTSVDALLSDDTGPAADPAPVAMREYKSGLSLEGIGHPYVSSGGGPFGTVVRGGGAVLFGDLLGDRRIGAAVEFSNRWRETAFAVRFLNQERRWNWGAVAELDPGLVRMRRAAAIDHGGQAAIRREVEYLQRAQLRAAGILAYPFSRAVRVEFSAGVRHAVFHKEVRSQVTSATGEVLETGSAASAGGEPLTLGEAGVALVRDTSVRGPTGPLLGSRMRLDLMPAIGELNFTSVTADVRHYFMPLRPYTIAVRMVHSAKYGEDGSDPRLLSTFLGSGYFVRGHRNDLRYCSPVAASACGNDLFGHQLLVGNLEIRVPVWGIVSRELEYGPVPMDAFLFVDGGLIRGGAGNRDRGASRISSIGAGLRINALGLPIELAGVRALDGPAPRWHMEFGLRVGF